VPSRKKLLIAYVRESAGVLGKQCRRTGLMGSVLINNYFKYLAKIHIR